MKVAIIEGGLIDPSRDAGSRAVFDLQQSLTRLSFVAKIIYVDEKILDQLIAFRPDAIIVSRYANLLKTRGVRSLLNVPLILWAQDLHSRRTSLHELLKKKTASHSLLETIMERAAISLCDVSVFPTQNDVKNATRKYRLNNILCHPYFYFGTPQQETVLVREPDLVFIGSSGHSPNLEGLKWFLNSCWPKIYSQSNKTKLWVIGDWDSQKFSNQDRVFYTRKIDEAQVFRIMQKSMIGISPLQFGAGLKRKTLQYLHSGLSVVTTDFGVEGLPLSGDDLYWRRANNAEQFVESVLNILANPAEALKMGNAGQKFVLNNYSKEIFDERLLQILAEVGLADPRFAQ